MAEDLRFLLLEDVPSDAELACRLMQEAGLKFVWRRVETRDALLAELEDFHPDLVLVDFTLPRFDGMSAIKLAAERAPGVPAVVFTGSVDEETAAECIKVGAVDYVLKERPARLARAVAGAVARAREQRQHRAAEAALKRSETRYRDLVDHATYGIYQATPEGRFLAVNPALIEMLGYESAEELLAVNVDTGVYADAAQRAQIVETCAKTGGIRKLEAAWKRRDGRSITVLLSGRPVLSERGDVEYFEMIAEDVTDQRRLAAQLRQAQKMEAVGQLTGGIAHDFNNVLSVILGNAQLLGGSLAPELVEAADNIREIEAAAERGAAMVKQLLGFSRHADLKAAPADVGSILGRTASMIRRMLPENIEIRLKLPEASRAALVDEPAVEQILLNLANNARDAMPGGGVLTLDLQSAQLGAEERELYPWVLPGDYLRVAVSDTGVGMDENTKGRIFEPFFTTKPPGVGTGLGMAMVYGLMKQMHGFVHVYSEPGLGSSISLYFPVAKEQARPGSGRRSERAADDAVRGGDETILLVEDAEPLRKTGRKVLERLGYTVLTAADGEEGLRLYRANAPDIDLILSDVVMPRMGGEEFYRAVRKEGRDVKFLLASGYRRCDTQEWLRLAADVPYLQKPWTFTSLAARVREVLEG